MFYLFWFFFFNLKSDFSNSTIFVFHPWNSCSELAWKNDISYGVAQSQKSTFQLPNKAFFYFLFHLIRIFPDSHKVYIERQKNLSCEMFVLPDSGWSEKKKKKSQISCKWGKVSLCSVEISITIIIHFPSLQKLVRNSAFSQSGKKISSGTTKWNYVVASSAPDVLRLAFICCVFILWQPDKLPGSTSASTRYHWTRPLNKSCFPMLLGPILLHLQSTDVPPALLFFFPVTGQWYSFFERVWKEAWIDK